MTLHRKALALLVLIALFVLLTLADRSEARGDRNCAPRDVVLERLADRYGETLQAIGLGPGGVVVEVMAVGGGTWTVIVTTPSGVTCLIASGTNYEAVNAPPAPEGDDT